MEQTITNHPKPIALDALIIGGGIAGLWTLATLKQRSYSVILIEKNQLGGEQTLASQGIIHGGTKYALTGILSGAAEAIAAMPQRWASARAGKEAVDLSAARLLSPRQYLWVNHGIGNKLTAFFAGKVMQSRMQRLQAADLPEFLPRDFAGHCYTLEESIFHLPDVLAAFARQFHDAIFTQCDFRREGKIIHAAGQAFLPERIIFTAGKNNAALSGAPAQLRPLHMAALRVPDDAPDIFGHYLGMSDTPKVTITTHFDARGKVYYCGGKPAEEGICRDEAAQIAALQTQLEEALPWLPRSYWQGEWRTFFVDRAEGENGGQRPDLPTIITHDDEIVVFPTKLAFAPYLADKIAALLPPPRHSASFLPPARNIDIGQFPWLK